MLLELSGHDFRYESEQIILLLFPKHESITLKSVAHSENGIYIVESVITDSDRRAEYCETAVCETDKDKANAVKRSAYYAGKKLSGLDTPWGILTGIRPAKPMRMMLSHGKCEEEIRRIFSSEYLVSKEKLDLGLCVAKKECKLISQNTSDVSVYIGIPFCPTRCVYCSFISHDAVRMKKLAAEYTEKLCTEIVKTGEMIRELGLNLRTVYFGGGTPTAIDEDSLRKLTNTVADAFDMKNILEYTVEAGRPDTVTPAKLEILKNAGVSRISINPQTIHDRTLEVIGRRHTYADFLTAFSLAREYGFDNINCDLIAGLPGEKPIDFKKSVDALTELQPENITIHTLYIKRASFLKNSGITLPNPAEATEMVEYGMKTCISQGFDPYYLYKQKTTLGNLENVGYAAQNRECIYNIDTMSDTCSVIALGAGGVSKVVKKDRIERTFNYKNADEYISGFDEIMRRKDEIVRLFKEM